MPSLDVLRVLARELTTSEHYTRITEPDLVMDDPEKVTAYTRAGREDGVMAPVYLFHSAQICDVVKPGDTVIDLACGPATQLCMVARLNPETSFIGADLSNEMLDRAQNYVDELGLTNVVLRKTDISDLSSVKAQSLDAVISTMALHHLPNISDLDKTFAEVKRILKQDGGIYLVDFGRLKSEKSINYFAYQYADRQPELFTLDYLYSLRAAFSLADFKNAWRKHLKQHARLHSTFLFPYMIALKSPNRRKTDPDLKKALGDIRRGLPKHHQTDLKDLISFFRLGGIKSTLL